MHDRRNRNIKILITTLFSEWERTAENSFNPTGSVEVSGSLPLCSAKAGWSETFLFEWCFWNHKHQINTKLNFYNKTRESQTYHLLGLRLSYNGAGHGIRTRDFRLGKPTLYRWTTPALSDIIAYPLKKINPLFWRKQSLFLRRLYLSWQEIDRNSSGLHRQNQF